MTELGMGNLVLHDKTEGTTSANFRRPFKIEAGVLDIASSLTVGVVIETGCTYFESVTYPETVEAGLTVTKLGRSSVTYGIGIFKQGGAFAAAQGHFVHVYVDRTTQRPVDIPGAVRTKLEALLPEPQVTLRW